MATRNQVSVTVEPILREYLESKVIDGTYESLSHGINTAIRKLMRGDEEAKKYVEKDQTERKARLIDRKRSKKTVKE